MQYCFDSNVKCVKDMLQQPSKFNNYYKQLVKYDNETQFLETGLCFDVISELLGK